MKLLIVTQVVDTEHPILGFFHRWIEEFAKHCEQVHVICLQAGTHSLPENVTVHSLEKEAGSSRLKRLWLFYKYIWQLRHEYDNVFVHMNQVYVILGGLLWRVWGKKIGLWYMHGTVSSSLKVAEKITHSIFSGSKKSFRLASRKLLVTGHGIDTEHFCYSGEQKTFDLITVGRIGQSKNLMVQIDVVKELAEQGVDISLMVVGGAVTQAEKRYEGELHSYAKQCSLEDRIKFIGRVPQSDLPAMLSKAKVFVTTAQNGSLDKAILEAMSCGLTVVSIAPGAASLPLGSNQVSTETQLTRQIKKVLESGVFKNQTNAQYVKEHHSIKSLIPKILQRY